MARRIVHTNDDGEKCCIVSVDAVVTKTDLIDATAYACKDGDFSEFTSSRRVIDNAKELILLHGAPSRWEFEYPSDWAALTQKAEEHLKEKMPDLFE